MNDHEWTDWRDHDGKGVPAELRVGMLLEAESLFSSGFTHITGGVLTDKVLNSKCWDMPSQYGSHTRVLRYRIRKPRALQAMIERAAALPVVKHLEVTE